jgi:hypothetical protein
LTLSFCRLTFGKKKYRTGAGPLLEDVDEKPSLLSGLLHGAKFPKFITPPDVKIPDEGEILLES